MHPDLTDSGKPASEDTDTNVDAVRDTMKNLNYRIRDNCGRDDNLTDEKMLKILFEYDEMSVCSRLSKTSSFKPIVTSKSPPKQSRSQSGRRAKSSSSKKQSSLRRSSGTKCPDDGKSTGASVSSARTNRSLRKRKNKVANAVGVGDNDTARGPSQPQPGPHEKITSAVTAQDSFHLKNSTDDSSVTSKYTFQSVKSATDKTKGGTKKSKKKRKQKDRLRGQKLQSTKSMESHRMPQSTKFSESHRMPQSTKSSESHRLSQSTKSLESHRMPQSAKSPESQHVSSLTKYSIAEDDIDYNALEKSSHLIKELDSYVSSQQSKRRFDPPPLELSNGFQSPVSTMTSTISVDCDRSFSPRKMSQQSDSLQSLSSAFKTMKTEADLKAETSQPSKRSSSYRWNDVQPSQDEAQRLKDTPPAKSRSTESWRASAWKVDKRLAQLQSKQKASSQHDQSQNKAADRTESSRRKVSAFSKRYNSDHRGPSSVASEVVRSGKQSAVGTVRNSSKAGQSRNFEDMVDELFSKKSTKTILSESGGSSYHGGVSNQKSPSASKQSPRSLNLSSRDHTYLSSSQDSNNSELQLQPVPSRNLGNSEQNLLVSSLLCNNSDKKSLVSPRQYGYGTHSYHNYITARDTLQGIKPDSQGLNSLSSEANASHTNTASIGGVKYSYSNDNQIRSNVTNTRQENTRSDSSDKLRELSTNSQLRTPYKDKDDEHIPEYKSEKKSTSPSHRNAYKKQLQSLLETPDEAIPEEDSSSKSVTSCSSTATHHRNLIAAYRKKWSESRKKSLSWKNLNGIMSLTQSEEDTTHDEANTYTDKLPGKAPVNASSKASSKTALPKIRSPRNITITTENKARTISDEIKIHLANSPRTTSKRDPLDDANSNKSNISTDSNHTVKSSNISVSPRHTVDEFDEFDEFRNSVSRAMSSPRVSSFSSKTSPRHTADEAGGSRLSPPKQRKQQSHKKINDSAKSLPTQQQSQKVKKQDKLSSLLDKLYNGNTGSNIIDKFPRHSALTSRQRLIAAYRRQNTNRTKNLTWKNVHSLTSRSIGSQQQQDQEREHSILARRVAAAPPVSPAAQSLVSFSNQNPIDSSSTACHSLISDPVGYKSAASKVKGILRRRDHAEVPPSPSDASISTAGGSRISWKYPISDRNEHHDQRPNEGGEGVFHDGQFKLWGGFYVLD